MVMLAKAVSLLKAKGSHVVNIDVTVVAEQPKLAPRRAELEQRLSATVAAPVTIKGKRAEGLGSLGRAEGIACWAVALIEMGP